MFGFKTSIKTENITPVIIGRWENLYGKDLHFFEMDGKKGYLRLLSNKEVEKLVIKTSRPNAGLATSLFVKKVLKEAWLGGDIELIENETYLRQIIDLYMNLPDNQTVKLTPTAQIQTK